MNLLPISVIIPTLNRKQSLIDTIISLLGKKYIPNEIIIIDQSEVMEDYEFILKNKFKDVKFIIKHLEERSSAIARNVGIELASNEILIFSDDDIEVNENTVINIYNTLMKDDKISLVGALDINTVPNNNKISKLMSILFFKRKIVESEGYVLKSMYGRYPLKFKGIVDTQWAMGYFFATRRSLIIDNNLFFDDKLKYYSYAEDLDFTYSIYKHSIRNGQRMILDEDIFVKHLVTQEWRTYNKHTVLFRFVNRRYFSYKHFNSRISMLMVKWSDLGDYFQAIIYNKNYKDIIEAIRICNKYSKQIKKGILNFDLFMSDMDSKN